MSYAICAMRAFSCKRGWLVATHLDLQLGRANEGYNGLAGLERNSLAGRFRTSRFRSSEELLGRVSYLGKRTPFGFGPRVSGGIGTIEPAGETACLSLPGDQLPVAWRGRLFCPATPV